MREEAAGDGTLMLLRGVDRLVGLLVAGAKWLALPLITLLFLQWPLRDVVRGWSREANDLGQVVVRAVRGAQRDGGDAGAHPSRRRSRRAALFARRAALAGADRRCTRTSALACSC